MDTPIHMFAPVIASHKASEAASAQLGADGKCSKNSFPAMRAEAISSKPARNKIVRTWSILCRVEIDLNSGALLKIYGHVFRAINIAKAACKVEGRSIRTLSPRLCLFVPERAENIHLPVVEKKHAGFELSGISCNVLHRTIL